MSGQRAGAHPTKQQHRKNSLYHAAARSDKHLEELYAVGRSFSTGGGADRMRPEGMTMRIQTGFAILCLLAAATALSAPQASKTAGLRDPELLDAQAYRKLLVQYHGKPLLVTFWATWCEPCRDEYPMLNELAKQYAPEKGQVMRSCSDRGYCRRGTESFRLRSGTRKTAGRLGMCSARARGTLMRRRSARCLIRAPIRANRRYRTSNFWL